MTEYEISAVITQIIVIILSLLVIVFFYDSAYKIFSRPLYWGVIALLSYIEIVGFVIFEKIFVPPLMMILWWAFLLLPWYESKGYDK